MKQVKQLVVVLAALFMVTACQKEMSTETGLLGGLAIGTLKDSLGDCQPTLVSGTYLTDSTLTDSNYVYVQVNVTTPGVYRITTDDQNGFSFRDSGYFPSAGLQAVKLRAKGRPILPIITAFTVSFGTSSCTFYVDVAPGLGGGGNTAAYTLVSAANACSQFNVQGTYTTGTALNNTNAVTLQVNVTTAGTYSVTTGVVNGIRFSGSGTFTATGPQTITLRGSGTPVTAGTTTVPVTAGSSTCAFTVTVAQGSGGTGGTAADSAWSFNQGNRFFYGPMDTAFSQSAGALGTFLYITGSTFATGDSTLDLLISIPGPAIVPGNYAATSNGMFDFSDLSGTSIYYADPTTTGATLSVTISSYNPTTRVVIGTFQGTAENDAGVLVPISNGKFRAVVN